MEQASESPVSKLQIFEDSLPQDSLNSLKQLLMANELKNLRTKKEAVTIAQGEIVWALIPREDTLQMLNFAGLEGSGKQHSQELPAAIKPLLDWLQTTIKGVKQHNLRSLRDAKATNCGLFLK